MYKLPIFDIEENLFLQRIIYDVAIFRRGRPLLPRVADQARLVPVTSKPGSEQVRGRLTIFGVQNHANFLPGGRSPQFENLRNGSFKL